MTALSHSGDTSGGSGTTAISQVECSYSMTVCVFAAQPLPIPAYFSRLFFFFRILPDDYINYFMASKKNLIFYLS